MKTILILSIMGMFLVFCTNEMTISEKLLIDSLSLEYPGMKFKSYEEIYLQIYSSETVPESTYFNVAARTRGRFPEIRWAYINVYNSDGIFRFQLGYSNRSKQFVKGNHEFH